MNMDEFIQLSDAWGRLGEAVRGDIRTIFVSGGEVPLPELISSFGVSEQALTYVADFLELVVQVADVNDPLVMEADDVLSDIGTLWGAE